MSEKCAWCALSNKIPAVTAIQAVAAGIFAVFLLLAWTLCRAAGWEKEREDLEQEQYLKEWREKKLKKIEKI